MARALNRLSDVYVRSTKLEAGRHSDGGGLYLNVATGGSKSWLFMWARDGKRREMGMGAFPAVSLAKARAKAIEFRTVVADGRDPIIERDKEAESTFGDAADKFLASMEKSWKNEKHRAQWKMTLEQYCAPMRAKRVSAIGTDDILAVLTPIWHDKAETASRLRGRIERVLDFARAKGWRQGENPALWRGHLKSLLPTRQKLQRGHHPAMPYGDVPDFVARLQVADAMAARGLEFLILTAGRSGEVLEAEWTEFDLDTGVWTVPARRMKAGKEHRVPLSDRALSIVRALYETRINNYVFPGHRKDRPLSVMAFTMLLRRMKVGQYTAHGFRSSFRDWTGDCTTFAREVAEAALAHEVGNKVELAYRRSDALEKRRKLMTAWANFCVKGESSNVVRMKRQRSQAVTGG
ncbi:tyrosine-type recombinase/integrase [Aminobacter aminovorans]|nr:integrase arm-type DNA-binding domain-containing protein [Aminobacter aminovorans]